jgi:hypothetical protein
MPGFTMCFMLVSSSLFGALHRRLLQRFLLFVMVAFYIVLAVRCAPSYVVASGTF